MDTQLDQIITRTFLIPLRKKLLHNLNATMISCRKEDWFSVFLATFVVLTNAEWLLQHSRRSAIRYGASQRYNSIPLAEEYFHTCRIVLANFHHVCRGAVPLNREWSKTPATKNMELDSEQAMFIMSVRTKMAERAEEVRILRKEHRYESGLYWCHQLFEDKWEPGTLSIKDEVKSEELC